MLQTAQAEQRLIATIGRCTEFCGSGATTSMVNSFVINKAAAGKRCTWMLDVQRPVAGAQYLARYRAPHNLPIASLEQFRNRNWHENLDGKWSLVRSGVSLLHIYFDFLQRLVASLRHDLEEDNGKHKIDHRVDPICDPATERSHHGRE